MAGAGAIKSTAYDMLIYLDANLHPEKYSAGSSPASPAAPLPAAIALDHEPQAELGPEGKIALAWQINLKIGSYDHSGRSAGYGSLAIFNPRNDLAEIAIYNREEPLPRFVDSVAENVAQLLRGEPSLRVDVLTEAEKNALAYMNGGGLIGDRQ